MDYRPVTSTNLRQVAYDPTTNTLGVIFKNNTEYHYYNVPEVVYRGLMSANSHGSYLAAHVKGHYRYQQIH